MKGAHADGLSAIPERQYIIQQHNNNQTDLVPECTGCNGLVFIGKYAYGSERKKQGAGNNQIVDYR